MRIEYQRATARETRKWAEGFGIPVAFIAK
jgi:hypothetical protein